jgi:NitT/TauT family transport system substrate-binding protein
VGADFVARRLATSAMALHASLPDGRAADNPDLGILVMRKDFMEKYPAVAKGYLRSELEAQRYLLDPANWQNVIEMVSKHATGVPKKVLWYSIYGKVPA